MISVILQKFQSKERVECHTQPKYGRLKTKCLRIVYADMKKALARNS